MEKELVKKLEDVVTLMKDPDEVVLIKEVIQKLEKILEFARNPEGIKAEEEALKHRMEEIIRLVNDSMIDLDVDLEYHIPVLGTGLGTDDVAGHSHILLSYAEDEYNTRTRKVSLGKTALQSTPEDLTKHVILAIEEFKDEIDDIRMG